HRVKRPAKHLPEHSGNQGDLMFSKLSLSISAALLLSAFGGVVRAASVPAGSDIAAAESGNPDSTEYSKRVFSRHSPSNDEINAAETGNPESINNQDGGYPRHLGIGRRLGRWPRSETPTFADRRNAAARDDPRG